jgi:hypothetical protein
MTEGAEVLLRATRPVTFALTLLASACRMDSEERSEVLQQARVYDQRVSSVDVVRELRSPTDQARLIYTPPVNLSEQAAEATGAAQVWAPFGIALPDSAQKGRAKR